MSNKKKIRSKELKKKKKTANQTKKKKKKKAKTGRQHVQEEACA